MPDTYDGRPPAASTRAPSSTRRPSSRQGPLSRLWDGLGGRQLRRELSDLTDRFGQLQSAAAAQLTDMSTKLDAVATELDAVAAELVDARHSQVEEPEPVSSVDPSSPPPPPPLPFPGIVEAVARASVHVGAFASPRSAGISSRMAPGLSAGTWAGL